MIELLIDKIHDPKFLAMFFAAIAAAATVLTLAMPLLAGDNLDKRIAASRSSARRSGRASASGWRAARRSRCAPRPSST